MAYAIAGRCFIDAAPLGRRTRWRRGAAVRRLIAVLGVVALAGWGIVHYFRAEIAGAPTEGRTLTHRIAREDLVVTVTEDGALESASNIDIKCEVAGGSTILSIVKDGTHAKEGDVLFRLDSSTIEEQINTQKIAFEAAKAAKIQAETEFAAAKIAVQEYLEGTYLQSVQVADADIVVAKENLHSAQNTLQYTERMARKGYVTALQRDAQAFAVERAKLDLAAAETAKRVLENFTRAKMVGELEAKRDSAEAKKQSSLASYELEELKLNRLLTQLAKCEVKAPSDGLVIYANEQGFGRGGQQSAMVEEGASVRERQSILRLPDLSKMQVRVMVHESKVDSIQIGMRARIRVQDKEFQGAVTAIANQPEINWWAPTVKKYITTVKIDGESSDLRPGLTAAVEILVASQPNALSVPVQAVVEQGGEYFCWVSEGNSPQRRPVVLGLANATSIEIKDGLKENEEVVLNPRSAIPEARQERRESVAAAGVEKRFGKGPDVALASARGTLPPGSARAGEPRGPSVGESAPGPGGGESAPGPGGARRGGFDLLSLDKNGDQKVSKDEAPEQMRQFFDSLDGNHDGFIDRGEVAAMRRRAPPSREGVQIGRVPGT